MANAVTITIKDESKTAICRETLALCGKYSITVSNMTGSGYLLLFAEDALLPYKGAEVPINYLTDTSILAYAALTQGVGSLDLRALRLVEALKTRDVGSTVGVKFAVYDTTVQEGMIGNGTLSVRVTRPYDVTATQSLLLFKGDKGDPGYGKIVETELASGASLSDVIAKVNSIINKLKSA